MLHFYTIFIVSISMQLQFLIISISTSPDSISSGESLAGNQTLVSANDTFELGFFSPGSSNKWYLGIWFKNIPDMTVVWVANRDNPASAGASLNLSGDGNSNIVVFNELGRRVWSSNQSKRAKKPVLQLLPTGNLVLREEQSQETEQYLWQSFDFPTDTLLPDMRLRRGSAMASWKSPDDPAMGDFELKIDTRGSPELYLYRISGHLPVYRTGPWDGSAFSGMPEMRSTDDIAFNFVSGDDVYYSFTIKKGSSRSRLVVNGSGAIERSVFVEEGLGGFWNLFWYSPKDRCDGYGECGPFGRCDPNESPVCECAGGFEPRNAAAWELRHGAGGCVRRTELHCPTDGFLALEGMKLPESSIASPDKNCREACLRNCSCTAYASLENGGCVVWTDDLLDMRQYSEGNGGQLLFIRLAASDLGSRGEKKQARIKALSITIGICIVLCGVGFCVMWKRKRLLNKRKMEHRGPLERSQDFLLNPIIVSSKMNHSGEETQADDLELPLFHFNDIAMATDNFSHENLLGQGGFGCVYKAILVEGQQVAVKRLSKNSGQGVEEFKNEVKLIARLQHRNLVRLLGCCVEANEKMLIYELMEHKSLDSIIFDPARSSLLNWQRRFDIVCGIARGLLYLHRDSRFRIIHRDLKASNILLDGGMNPKISDFGMARIFGGDQIQANTKRIVGTYGYMAPEYAMDGVFSVKSDVFSFGVLVLEIVSGKRNRGFYNSDHDLNLLGHAWKLWREGNGVELADSSMSDQFSTAEVSRCVQVGLLCVQEHAEDRPDMAAVLLMLSSESAAMPQPNNPGFDPSSTKNQQLSFTFNQVTMTTLDGR